MKRASILTLCIFLLFIMTACNTKQPETLKDVTSIQLTGEGTLRKLEITGFPVTKR